MVALVNGDDGRARITTIEMFEMVSIQGRPRVVFGCCAVVQVVTR